MTPAQLPQWYLDAPHGLDHRLGLVVSELTAQRVVGSLPVAGNTQPFGLFHGGASATLIEALGSLGALAHAYPERVAVGVDLNVTHLAPAREGRVTGVATAVRLGGRTAVYQVQLCDDDAQVTAVGRLTCQLIAPPQATSSGG
ncbi:MAG: PaaI family thioesterase [Arachnia sp.]